MGVSLRVLLTITRSTEEGQRITIDLHLQPNDLHRM